MSLFGKILSTVGLGGEPFDASQAPQTEGEIRAASERRPPGWVYVKTLDHKGRVLAEEWKFEQPPQVFENDGFAQFPTYVDKLLASKNWFTSLGAFTNDGERGISVWNNERQIQIHEHFTPERSEQEKRVRVYCREKGFPIAEDYVADREVHIVAWNLPKDIDTIVETMEWIASEVHAIEAHEGLEFRLEEHEDERNRYPGSCSISFLFTYPIEDPSAPAPV